MSEEQILSEEQKNDIRQLAALAKQSETALEVDWNQLAVTEDEAYIMMASNVLEQMSTVPEEHKAVVCMATMTKLLVENFVLNLMIKGLKNESE